MSAAEAVLAALKAALPEIGGATLPRRTVEIAGSADWGTKTEAGREVITRVTVRVAEGQAGRLPGLMAEAEIAGASLGGVHDGWRVASAVAVRSRMTVEKGGERVGVVEHRVRVLTA